MSRDGAQVFEFNADGKHLRTRSASTGTTLHTFGYDPTSKLLTSITDRDGNVTSVTRAPGTITITAPGGQETVLTLDGNGYLASVQNPVTAEITQLTHSASGLLTDLVDPRGFAHHFDYAPDGRLRKDTNATPGSLGTRLAASSDANGWTVDLLSPENRLTRHRVDRSGPSIGDAIIEHRVVTAGGLSSVIDQLIDGSKNTISPDGTKVTVLNTAADPRWGVAASFESEVEINVGATPNVRTMTRTEERTASLAIPGDPFSVSAQTIKTTRTGGGLPNAETTRVFSAGPPAKWVTTTPAGRQIEEILDAKERVTQVSILGTSPVELYPRQFHYNDVAPPLGHVDQSTWGARTIGIEHDPLTGWVKKVTAPENLGVEFKARDNNGRPTRVELPGGLELQTLYDLGGNIVSVTPPTRPAHAFSFDPNSRLASYAPPDLVPALSPKNTLYTYDHDGLLTGLLHPNAPVHTTYDALGRASLVTGAVTTSYGYAPQGQLQTIATSDGVTTTNTWNGALLAAQTTSGPFTQTLQKTYDNFFRVSSWNIDGTPAIPITRDGDDFITGVAGMTVTRSLNYLLTKTSVGTVDDDFTYNRYGEALTHTTSGVSGGYSASYARDNAGRLLSKSETIDSVTHTHDYHYDPAGRLWKVHVDGSQTPTRTFTYDDNGNRSGGTYDDQDRLVAFGGFAYEYGNNGDLKKKIDTSTSAETVYTYDARGNLRTVVRPSPAVPATIEYLIDGLNRRIGKKEDNVFVQGFVYDGPRIVAELDATGNVKSRFVYATVGHSPDLMLSGGNTYRFVKDHLGSPRLVVRSDTGAIAQRIDYDEWGIVTADSAPGFQPFGFAGGLYDPDTKLVRFGARDYDPPTGRWTSKEPLGFAGSLNFYAYVDNDPVNWIDPTGLDRSWVILVFGPWGALLDSSQIFDRSFIDAGRDIPDGGSNGPGDAYRHCLASCRVAERYGAAFSHAVGEANEIRGDWAHDQTKAERDMDSHNNACGRSYAGSGECEQKCKNGLSNGDLRTLEPGFSKQSYWDKPNGFTLIPVP